MFKRIAPGLKKAAALMMSLFIVLSQFALPMAALAQDLSKLPTLYLSYPAGEGTQSVSVMPALYQQQPVYWATVPADALQNGVTLEIVAPEGVGDTYNSTAGYQLYASDAGAVDSSAIATMIEVYQGGGYAGAYPLYISTRFMPEEPPMHFDPQPVQINCFDQNGQWIGGYSDSVGMEGKTFYAESIDGYELTGADSVTVTMDGNGLLSHYNVDFYYTKVVRYAAITMKIVDSANRDSVFYSNTEDYAEGSYSFIADPGYLPADYQLDNSGSVNVNVYADGTADMYEVIFTATYYPPAPKTATITMKIVDSANWDSVFYSNTEEYTEGSYSFIADPGYLPADYQLDNSGSVNVNVYSDGTADMYEVIFTATYYAPAPKTATITMKIVDSANWDSVFYSNTEEYTEGSYSFIADAGYLPADYQLDNANAVTVNVYADGTADMYEVIFTATYYAPAPKTATITMKIVDSANWDSVFYSNTEEYTEGSYSFMADPGYLPADYQLDNSGSVNVNVYADGTADMYEVIFTATYYAPAPKTATITMKIVDSANWDSVFYSNTEEYTEGSYSFMADPGYLPADYQLDNANAVTVNVYADGTADMYEVIFTATYVAPQQPETPVEPEAPKKATITMKIVDSANWESVFFSNTEEYTEGSYSFMADPGYLPADYQLDNANSVTVNVYADGTADMYEVIFTATYVAPQQPETPVEPEAPKKATITMKIVDSANRESVFFSNTEEYTEGSYSFMADPGYLPADYQLDNANAVTVNVYADGTADMYEVIFTATYVAPQQPEQNENSLPEGCTLISEINANGKTTAKDLALREGPGKSYGKNVVRVAKNVELWVNSLLKNADGEEWYSVSYNGETRYVMASYVEIIASEQPISVPVTFLYQDENGATLMDAYTENFIEGTHQTAGFFRNAPEGYEYKGVNAETIVVDANGANPATVVFTYAAVQVQPVQVEVTLSYECEGMPFKTEMVTLSAGTYQVSDYVREFEGYTYTGASREVIVITEDGRDSDTFVTFTYNRNPVTAFVTIHHRLEDGTEMPTLSTESKTLEKNTYTASDFVGYAEGYTFLYASPETFTVDENNMGPFEVFLYYRRDIAHADVTIYVQDENGAPIPGMDSYTVNLVEGQHNVDTIRPDTPEGYTFVDSSAYMVEVTANGADPAHVTFTYSRIPVEAQVSFRFADEQGYDVPGLESYTATLAEGVYSTADFVKPAPNGYLYVGVSADTVVVDRNGAAPFEVYFTYSKLPETVSIPVYHKDANGLQLLDTTYLTFGAADFGTMLNVNDLLSVTAPEGYILGGVDAQTVTIDSRGGVSPAAITVTYVVRPIAEADVTFHYLCEGRSIAESQTHKLSEGVWDTNEYAVNVDGYKLVSVSSADVTVGEDGAATPAEVTFTYEKLVTTAFLNVHYRNSFGEELTGSPEVRELGKGTHVITPNAAYVPAGYVLSANTQVFEVTVHDDLTLSVPSVSFNYYDANLKATVTVNYHDTETAQVFATEQVQLAPGTHQLQPNLDLVKSKGNYEKSDILVNSTVVVDEKGKASAEVIVFYFKPAAYTGYQGYLLTTQQTVLRTKLDSSEAATLTLAKDTVLFTTSQYQSGQTEWYGGQTVTGESAMGWVDGSHVRRISAEEAQIYIEEANQPEELEQVPGYYITLMNNVPLRQYKNTASQAKYLNVNTVVWVDGQEYDDSNTAVWHRVNYENINGYILDGQLRRLTQEEVDAYLAENDPITPGDDPNQYDPNAPSSYGYVTTDKVNFRSEPGGTKLKWINKYGMALILDTREVNGAVWYNINYDGQLGWIHGSYFHQMTLSEFTSFVGSEAYYEGIANNAAQDSGSTGGGSTGSPSQGSVSSVEDWNVGIWQNPGVETQPTYQPFNPYATPVATTNPRGEYTVDSADVKLYDMASENATSILLPEGAEISIKGTVNANGKTWYQVAYGDHYGYVDVTAVMDKISATPTPAPTATFAIGTMIPIQYDDQTKETQSGTVPWGLIGGLVVLVGGAGGVYAFALNQNKKRKAAARAAASKRAAAANAAAAGGTSPYARRAVAAAPGAQQRPAAPNANVQPAQQGNPYSRPAPAQQPAAGQPANPYARPQTQAAPIVNPYAAPAAPAQQANPYASANTQSSNPYAAPAQKPGNPYAAPVQPNANPYARPVAPAAPAAQPAPTEAQPAEGEAPAPRRSRMQRYHSDNSAGTDA